MNEKQAIASAILGLAVTEDASQTVGKVPSDEELAAYYEGGLNETRRAQILSYISADPDVYSRWISLVETADLLGLVESTATEADKSSIQASESGPSFWEKLSDYFSSKVVLSGASFAAAAMFVVVLQLGSGSDSVTSLYDEFGTTSFGDEISLPTRSFNPFAQEVDAGDVVLSEGFFLGLTQIDRAELVPDLHRYKKDSKKFQSEFSAKEVQWITELGAWGALSYGQCQGGDSEFFAKAESVLAKIQYGLSTVASPYSVQLVKDLNAVEGASAKALVCKAADLILARVR